MSRIVLSAATRASLLSAQDTASLLETTQNRLATGKKVSSALDNPTNFFTASGLDNRAGDLSALLDSIGNGVQTIQAASTGITNIQKLVDTAKSIANQAISDKSVNSSGTPATSATLTATTSYQGGAYATAGTQDFSYSNASATFTLALGASGAAQTITLDKSTLGSVAADITKVTSADIVAAINNQISNNTSLAGKVSAGLTGDGRLTFTTSGTGAGQKITANATGGTSTVDIGLGTASQTGANATLVGGGTALTGTTDFTGTTSKTFDVYDGHKTVTVKLDNTITAASKAAVTVAEIQTEINKQLTAGGSKASFTNASGIFTLGTSETGGAGGVGISGADIGFISFAAAARARGLNTTSAATAKVATGSDAFNGGAINTNRQSLAAQYKSILTQIDQLASDASYNGVNLLNDGSATNKLHISFNDRGTSFIDIPGEDVTSTGLSLKTTLGVTDADAGFQTDADINLAINNLTNATGTLRQKASKLGSNLTVVQNRQDFTKNLINVLQTGSANLTNADLNEEAANSQALSTRQSLAISALSLANTAQQGVLQLLR